MKYACVRIHTHIFMDISCIHVLVRVHTPTYIFQLLHNNEWPLRIFYYDEFPRHGNRNKTSRKTLTAEVAERVRLDVHAGLIQDDYAPYELEKILSFGFDINSNISNN